MYVGTYVFMYVCMNVCMYVCMHVCMGPVSVSILASPDIFETDFESCPQRCERVSVV